MNPAWSMKFTGTKDGVRKRVAAVQRPSEDPPRDEAGNVTGEPLNGVQFAACQQLITDMLNRSPVESLAITASGYHAADGRAQITITLEPVELHV